MRLIDADLLIQAIKEKGFCKTLDDCVVDMVDEINKLPTAFDVDKVVEQLKECERYIYDAVSDEDNYAIDTGKAIEILKGGGQG